MAKRQTTENTMAKRQKAKGTNNNLYNTIQKTKDRVTRTPLKNRGWTQVFRKGGWYLTCYSCYKPEGTSWIRKGPDCDYDKRHKRLGTYTDPPTYRSMFFFLIWFCCFISTFLLIFRRCLYNNFIYYWKYIYLIGKTTKPWNQENMKENVTNSTNFTGRWVEFSNLSCTAYSRLDQF